MASSNETKSQIHASNIQEDHEEQASSYEMQLVNSATLPITLHAALQLDIFQIISKAGADAKLSPQEIATQLGTQNPDAPMMLDRILWLLATYNVLTYSAIVNDHHGDPQRLYGLAPVSKSQSKDAIVEGGSTPFERVHGIHAFEYAAKDSRFNQVGGGLGVTLNFITSKYPSIKGINFDLPHVVQHAPPYPGVEHVGGDMFQSVPKGDAILVKWILHDWSDDLCVKLLKNCYDTTPDNGKVIVVDAIAPNLPKKDIASIAIAQRDVFIMIKNHGGKERIQHEFIELATRAGFGVTLSFITSKYPSIKGINFDLPHVVQHAPPYAGVEHVGGDMFHSVPKGDAIFMKWILHDWSDDHCVKLLKNCYDAIPDNGKVIVVDAIAPVLPDKNVASRAIAEMDVVMMTQNPGGKERTQQEFIKLATRAGFSSIKYKCFVFNSWVMEFFK
ncbi:hypothetical protein SLEP1_g27165 [Rubroshorea leprosula]|uniref:Uncharacterized protein n=1 Tax=Rubroshorea leprosula TaxID=152421 RepID=A0AAV5JWL9_9ROSI|nr:hypothetical protein SLEP1_g27165 [Rubroshorea leprosula]